MKILAITAFEKWDPLATIILEGLEKCGVELYCTYPGNGAINTISDEEFSAHYPTTDYILAFFTKMETPPPKYYLIDIVQGWGKTAYIDGSEWNYTGYNGRTDKQLHPLFREKARWYFKRECLPEHVGQGIIPLPFGAVDSDFGGYECEKDIDVLCSFGQRDTGLRAEAVRAVRELAREGYRVITSLDSDYLRYVSRSWITVEAYGGGECNERAWLIMANKSAMFAQKYNIVIPYLGAGWDYIAWESGEQLQWAIKHYLAKKEFLRSFIDRAYDNLLEHHTSQRRAEYILEHLRSDP